jgi:hypothetical protein
MTDAITRGAPMVATCTSGDERAVRAIEQSDDLPWTPPRGVCGE